MRSTTVAFRGVSQVVAAYEANGMPAWAICNGDCIMFADETGNIEEGTNSLRDMLKKMQQGGSEAQFTLRVYELLPKGKILSNTPCSRSFGFKLYESDEDSPFQSGRRNYAREADEKIRALEVEIAKLRLEIEEAEEPEPEGGINGFIAGIATDPMFKQMVMQGIAGLVQKIVPMPMRQPAAVAGIANGQEGQVMPSVLKDGQLEKIHGALDLLCTRDPDLGDHLQKLASIALTNPQQFQWLLGMLQNF